MSGMASIFSTHARRADLAPKMNCKCGKVFTLGVDGTVDGCDACTGTDRAANGYALQSDKCCCYEYVADNEKCPVHGKK